MGSRLSRSSSGAQAEGSKSRWKRGKRKGAEKLVTPIESNKFLTQNNHERESSVANFTETYEAWNKRSDQQDIPNFNVDPPGAPSTFSANYPLTQNDVRERTWSSPQNLTNQFYPNIPLSMTTAPNMNYEYNQYISTTMDAQSQQMMAEERLSKKLQLARAAQQQSLPKTPLANTQSWHEPSSANYEISSTPPRQEHVPHRQVLHRAGVPVSNSTTNQTAPQKPIYVGIDHKATLAERGQTTTHRRHQKSVEKSSTDVSVTSITHQRPRSHAHHQHKHQETGENSSSKEAIKSNRSFERLQAKLSGSTRPLTTTIIANKQAQHGEQSMVGESDVRVNKTRSNRHTQSQHIEQQALVDNEVRTSRNRGSHSHAKQQQSQSRSSGSRNNSPLRTEIPRRVDNKHQNGPIMKIPITQQPQRQKQVTIATGGTLTPPALNRTRV
ncbi:unnamed protein product [Adineta ricciae]|uniref:Uncharacterized protein n=1 Tax=Adineta ricciae TaxID=249248 RepID=A0A814E4K3_ADIRI|nr:unnamed protein product [Adineta ricciae]CAF1197218.1 unnamed protein product [Adineta ricciae]